MGGARKGAGRKPGAKDSKPRQTAARKVAEAAASEGITPAEIMLNVARHLYAEACDPETGRIRDNDKAMVALAAADKAAPYWNAKLSTIDHKSSDGTMTPPQTIVLKGVRANEGRGSAS